MEPTLTPELGEIFMEENAGFLLLMLRVVELVAVPPLLSVVVAVHVTISLGMAIEESSVIDEPVPIMVLPLLHS